MDFGDAIKKIKAGNKMTRKGWNGKNMFVYYVPENRYPAQTEAARSTFGDTVPYKGYIALKTTDNDVVPWLASQTDLLADDWEHVD